METFLEILKFTIPSLITFGVAFVILNKFMQDQQEKRMFELKKQQQDYMTPIKLQAYERLTLFLERVSPTNLIPRINRNGMTAKQLHQGVHKNIRSEYEHNLAQQIYVSPQTWAMIGRSKEELVKMVNVASTKVDPNGPAIELTKVLYDIIKAAKGAPTQKALNMMKQEINKQFR